jgi:ligand-binding sensor domain-containing protein
VFVLSEVTLFMMRLRSARFVWSLIPFLFIVTTFSAQRIVHLNTNHGLCTNSLTDLTLDRNGNMWIGSYNGLMKYTGTGIKCFDKVGNGPDAISGPEMHSIAEDECGNMWVGTTAGLNKIDPVTHMVMHYAIRSPLVCQRAQSPGMV